MEGPPSGIGSQDRTVWSWLTGPQGKEWLAPTDSGKELYGWRYGWYPDDVDTAFLPEEFQAAR